MVVMKMTMTMMCVPTILLVLSEARIYKSMSTIQVHALLNAPSSSQHVDGCQMFNIHKTRSEARADAKLDHHSVLQPHEEDESGVGSPSWSSSQKASSSSAHSPSQSLSHGQTQQLMYQNSSRESRISALEMMSNNDKSQKISKALQSELDGLMQKASEWEEQYPDDELFDDLHIQFKRMHNEAFLALFRYCSQQRKMKMTRQRTKEKDQTMHHLPNVFFLDGPSQRTGSCLVNGGIDPSQCYVANRHYETCQRLRSSGGGLLPDSNVVHSSASDALQQTNVVVSGIDSFPLSSSPSASSSSLSTVDFVAYYFDGCGGYVPQIIDMITAALLPGDNAESATHQPATAIGFSLLGSMKDVANKELSICQALNKISKESGRTMKHVLDDPERYGISKEIRKVSGGRGSNTFTTWLILE